MKRRNSFRGRKSGFTLMEILLVLGLIGLLVSVVVVNAGSIFGDQKEKLTRMKIKDSMSVPLFKYMTDTGSYPTTEQGLQALLTKPSSDRGRWRGPYVESQDSLLDAWQRDFKYRFPGSKNPGSYDLYSLGADGVESGDDIGNWKQ
ncbi:type II secretion system major pseudopilin GspG [Pelagicoccus sp. SDUM812002]|nr:type II secretion system major pseudopilin GspG [Pelagicoccus sp. SDUM812002]